MRQVLCAYTEISISAGVQGSPFWLPARTVHRFLYASCLLGVLLKLSILMRLKA